VEEGKDVEEFGAGADVPVASVGREVGLGFVGPEGVEALVDVVLLDDAPIPFTGVGIGGVDVGAGAVVG
jgi:hypothetical protein